MCRKNKLWGCVLIAFGLGLLVGLCLERGFFCTCGALIIIFVGFCTMRRR